MPQLSDIDLVRWIPIQNNNAGPAPAFGLVRVTGVTSDGLALTVDQPNADSQTGLLVVGDCDIPSGQRGRACNAFPIAVRYYAPDGTPAAGQTWGAANGFWELRSGKTGFKIIGGVANEAVCVTLDVGGSPATTVFGSGSSVIFQSGATLEFQSGSTTTYDSGSTLVLAGPTANVTQNTTVAVTAGKTLTLNGTIALGTPLPVTSGGLGFGTVATGDLPYGSGTNALGKLSASGVPNGYLLTMSSGVPVWAAATGVSGAVAQQIFYGDPLGSGSYAQSSYLTFDGTATLTFGGHDGSVSQLQIYSQNGSAFGQAELDFYREESAGGNLNTNDQVATVLFHPKIGGGWGTLGGLVCTYTGNGTTEVGTIALCVKNTLNAVLQVDTSKNLSFPQANGVSASQFLLTDSSLNLVSRLLVSGDIPDLSGTYSVKAGNTSLVTVGTVTTGTWQGTKVGLPYGGTNADLSGTGGSSQYLKQLSTGAAVTVGTIAAADVPFDGARVYNSADQAMTSNVALPVSFDTNRKITQAGYHSTSINKTRLVPQTKGWHRLWASLWVHDTGSGSYRQAYWYLNGTTVIGKVTYSWVADAILEPTATYYLDPATDYVECYVVGDSTGVITLKNAGNYSPEATIEFAGT